MTSSTNAAAPRMTTPGTRSSTVRRAPGGALAADRDPGALEQGVAQLASGAARGQVDLLGAPGHRHDVASPVSHRLT